MRNKAAEKAKTSYSSGHSGSPSPSLTQVTAGSTGGSGGPGSGVGVGAGSPGSMGQQPGQQQQGLPMGIHGSDISAMQRPSYSINGILGIPQPDANANINKRKRDDNGKQFFIFKEIYMNYF